MASRRLSSGVAIGVVSAAILVVALISLVWVQWTGRQARRFAGEPVALSAEILPIHEANTSLEVLELWRRAGVRGRRVVHLSRFLHFVSVDNVVPPGLEKFPVATFDLVEAYKSRVDPRNWLWVALQEGLIREIVHVLPPADLESRRRSLVGAGSGIWFEGDAILTHELGSRRRLMSRLPRSREPVLLTVDASFLELVPPESLGQSLRKSPLQTDLFVLSYSSDNADVTDEGRQGLDQFAGSLGVKRP